MNVASKRQYVVVGDGIDGERFETLGMALGGIARRQELDATSLATDVFSAAPSTPLRFQITCVRPGEAARVDNRPRRRFYVEPQGGSADGDGSELYPWGAWSVADAALARMQDAGELTLEPSQSLVIMQRPVFSANTHENRKHRIEAAARLMLLLMTISLVAPVLAILAYLLVKAWPALSLEFVFQNPQDYMTAGGVWAPLVGTFFLVAISLLIAAPLGVLAGVYLNEYARDNWFTRIVNLAVVNLAGVPSIVHALFGVGAFVLFAGLGRSVLAASCTLAVMTLPVIITSTREALAAVPMSFREACWNLGASRWQTIRTIVLPNSISGILTGVILQVSRAAGETAPILFTGAVFFVPVAEHGFRSFFPYGLHDRCMALSMHLFTLSTQVNGVSDEMQYATAVVLIGLVLVVNSAAIALRVYLRTRKKW
ncbi:MAG: phosphate ABC transporter permease PstA [Pirellulaceae bacterium]